MSTKSSIRATAVAISLAASFFLPSAVAHAGIITINDATDNIGFTDTTGRIIFSNCGGEACTITFVPPPNTAASSATPNRINIFEDNTLSVVSDTLEITSLQGLFTANFLSDSESGGLLALPSPARSLVETGAVQDAFSITWFLADGSAVVDTIAFVSDIDTVPEPATLALFGFGLAGIAASLFRKQS